MTNHNIILLYLKSPSEISESESDGTNIGNKELNNVTEGGLQGSPLIPYLPEYPVLIFGFSYISEIQKKAFPSMLVL